MLNVTRVVERIVDPVTGVLLGVEEVSMGTATISEVKDQYAKATFQTVVTPVSGDTLTLSGGYAAAHPINNGNVAAR